MAMISTFFMFEQQTHSFSICLISFLRKVQIDFIIVSEKKNEDFIKITYSVWHINKQKVLDFPHNSLCSYLCYGPLNYTGPFVWPFHENKCRCTISLVVQPSLFSSMMCLKITDFICTRNIFESLFIFNCCMVN